MVTRAVEEVSNVDGAAAIMVDVQNTLVNYPINRYGTEAQKAKYLTRLTSDTIGAYALSEPSSGSDAFGLATRAEKHGDACRCHPVSEPVDTERTGIAAD